MDLWIRSQDKTRLSKINSIQYGEYQGAHYINGYCINDVDNIDLGIYATKERALEILDEIQDFIENRDTTKITQDIHGITSEVEIAKRVYNMPKE